MTELVVVRTAECASIHNVTRTDFLPSRTPYATEALWQELRQAQRDYLEAVDDSVFSAERHRAIAAQGFSRLVRALHGGMLPSWLREEPSAARLHRSRVARILSQLPAP